MKKILILVLIIVLGFALCACGSKDRKETLYEIVVVPAAWSDELNVQISEYVKDRQELNVYQSMAQEPDARYQALLVEDLIALEVDAICLQPVDASVLPVVQKAEEAGIVVLTGDDMLKMIDRAEEELKK